MKYILDTWRADRWRRLVPAPVLVAEENLATIALTANDIVFAHTPTDFRHLVSQTDHPVNTEAERRIKCFRQALIDAAEAGHAPMLVLYSGNPVVPAEASEWKSCVTRIALPKFPTQRIDVLGSISRASDHQFLQQLVEAVETKLQAAAIHVPHGEQSIRASEDLATFSGETSGSLGDVLREMEHSRSAVLALRLLCEAWMLNGGDRSMNHGGIDVVAPTTPNDWVTPFSELPPANAVVAIAAQMGDRETQRKVETLLGRLLTGIDSGVKLRKEEVRGTVDELLNTLKSAVR